jgi:hypothetical protein
MPSKQMQTSPTVVSVVEGVHEAKRGHSIFCEVQMKINSRRWHLYCSIAYGMTNT